MELAAQIIGLFAVAAYLLSYQQKKRNNIIIWNATSRILYIIQYMMLGAFSGAALDVLGTVSSVAAQNKDKEFIKKHTLATVIGINVLIVAAGLMLTKSIFDIFPIVGVILHTSAFWITNEKIIRRVSLLGCPFWLVYNLVSGAYGSAIGDALTIVSIGTAMWRYDIRKEM